MKKAMIDQVMLGFLLVTSLFVFTATLSDEKDAKNKYVNLEYLVDDMSNALANYYVQTNSMQEAEQNVTNLLNKTKLGQELISKNYLKYEWRDSNSDNFPDFATVKIDGYKQDNFWYRLINVMNFDLGNFTSYYQIIYDDKSNIKRIEWIGSDAGLEQNVGIYNLDENSCIENEKIIKGKNIFINTNQEPNRPIYENFDITKDKLFLLLTSDGRFDTDGITIRDYKERTSSGFNPGDPDIIRPGTQIDFKNHCLSSGKITNFSITEYANSQIFNTYEINDFEAVFFENSAFNNSVNDGKRVNGMTVDLSSTDRIVKVPDSSKSNFEEFVKTYLDRTKVEDGSKDTIEQWQEYAEQNNYEYEVDEKEDFYIFFEDNPDFDYNDTVLKSAKKNSAQSSTSAISIKKVMDKSKIDNSNKITT